MGYISITAGVAINNTGGVALGSPNNIQNINPHVELASGDVALFNAREGWNPGSFNLGPGGTPVTTTGRMLYNSDTAGSGYLTNLILTNRNGVSFYYGINTSGINLAQGTLLASGEQVIFDPDKIRTLWAIAATGTVNVYGHGEYVRNFDAI